MSRFGHPEVLLAKAFREQGRFKCRDSRVLRRKDGTLRFELRGKDKSDLREACFERDNYTCVDHADGRICGGPLQMSHFPPMSKSEGSDEIGQVFCRCQKHHVWLDLRGMPSHL